MVVYAKRDGKFLPNPQQLLETSVRTSEYYNEPVKAKEEKEEKEKKVEIATKTPEQKLMALGYSAEFCSTAAKNASVLKTTK